MSWFDGIRVAVIGSRDYPLMDEVRKFVARLPRTCTVISGGARGVDSVAEEKAKHHRVGCEVFRADWDKHGKRAGMTRNADIVKNSDCIIAFWDGVSRGTADTVRRAQANGRSVVVIGPDGRIVKRADLQLPL